jgi:hypothetical protein
MRKLFAVILVALTVGPLTFAAYSSTMPQSAADPGRCNRGECAGDCAEEYGMCVSYCQGDGQCIANCAASHGRCVSRCR